MREKIIEEASSIPEEYATGTHESERASLQQRLSKTYSNSLSSIFGHEVVHSVINAPVSFATGVATSAMVERFKSNIVDIEKENEKRSGTAEIRREVEQRKETAARIAKMYSPRKKFGGFRQGSFGQRQNIFVEGYEEEFPISSMYRLNKINMQSGLQGDEYLTYDDYKARKREEVLSTAGYMGYVYGTGLTDFAFMPSEAVLRQEYENYRNNYYSVQEQKQVLLGAKSYVEFKAKILREAQIYSPYAQMRGGFSNLECAVDVVVPSETEIREAYETYLSNYQYIQKQKQEIFGDIKSGLKETEREDYGHKVDYMQKLLHRFLVVNPLALSYLGDSFYLPSASDLKRQVAMSLKKTDQIYVVSVGVLRGGILFGEHLLNEMSPEAYTLVREGLSSLGKGLSKVMIGIRKADGSLHELFGSTYDIPKEIIGKEIKEFKEGAPKFVQGLTTFFLGERIVGVTLKGAGAIGKGALKVTKQAKREVEIFVRNAANKFDKLAKTGTGTLKGLSKSRIAITPEGIPFWRFADDAVCKNPTLFSVIEDTKFKSNVGDVKTKFAEEATHTTVVTEIQITPEIKAKVIQVVEKGDINDIVKVFNQETNWGISKDVLDSVPEHLWQHRQPARSFLKSETGLKPGIRFEDGRDSVRIMKGNPNSKYASERLDYVKISSNFEVVGKDGRKIKSGQGGFESTAHHPDAHISLKEWKQWRKWNEK